MNIRISLISKMILSIIFGFLSLVTFYAGSWYVVMMIKSFREPGPRGIPPGIDKMYAIRGIIFALGYPLLTFGLSALFGWLCARYIRQWRKF
jgi:uncharacterized BrkB/YihY/UPF0761 family membrane protein